MNNKCFIKYGFVIATLAEPRQAKNKENNTSVIQKFMKIYTILYSVTRIYTNPRKFMLSLKSYAFLSFYAIWEAYKI